MNIQYDQNLSVLQIKCYSWIYLIFQYVLFHLLLCQQVSLLGRHLFFHQVSLLVRQFFFHQVSLLVRQLFCQQVHRLLHLLFCHWVRVQFLRVLTPAISMKMLIEPVFHPYSYVVGFLFVNLSCLICLINCQWWDPAPFVFSNWNTSLRSVFSMLKYCSTCLIDSRNLQFLFWHQKIVPTVSFPVVEHFVILFR